MSLFHLLKKKTDKQTLQEVKYTNHENRTDYLQLSWYKT